MAWSLIGETKSGSSACTWSVYIRLCACFVRKLKFRSTKLCLFAIILLSLILYLLVTTNFGDYEIEDIEFEEMFDTFKSPEFALPVLNGVKGRNTSGLLLVLIHASGKEVGRERRDAIRATWVSEVDLLSEEFEQEISYKFVLGSIDVSAGIMKKLINESKVYKDMLFLDVPDSHFGLSLRTLRGFEYIRNNSMNYQYVLKCDDDTFVNLKAVGKELKAMYGEGRLYWGEFLGACKVSTEGIYSENQWYQCNSYVPYAYGGGYILSRDLVELIAINSPYLYVYKNEDVSVGAWLAPYSIKNRYDARFNAASENRGCKREFILSHRITPKLMHSYYESTTLNGYYCNHKHKWYNFRGHYYSWTKLPSKCCIFSNKIP